MSNKIVIIPSYKPSEQLITLIESLKENGLSEIVVVNDGGNEAEQIYFERAKQLGCTVLTHSVNLGKGRALKTAFNYVLQTYKKDCVAVCVDSDGQHLASDAAACLEKAENYPQSLIMGCRNFDDKSIPLRSRFGNKTTCIVFNLLCGVAVSDTQTGLRAMSYDLMKKFMQVKGERFEFEMNMLIEARNQNIPFVEVKIHTIYSEKNETSHFNPLRDSLKIYAVFLKFLVSSTASFVTDIVLFSVILALLKPFGTQSFAVVAATVGARIVSSLVNYSLNKNAVFKNQANEENNGKKSHITLIKYYTLCVIQMLCSAFLVERLLMFFPIKEVIVKLIVDSILFIISFQIQREWVFASGTKRKVFTKS